MSDKIFSKSQLPIRRSVDFLPEVFKTETNSKFLGGVLDPLIQPGVLEKTVGYIGRRYGKTYKSSDIYLDTDATLRSRYQLEPAVVIRKNDKVQNFYDYIDFKNQLRFFGNTLENDNLITEQDHYTWNPPIDWDKFTNYREYFWVPMGPPTVKVLGQGQTVTSTYKVRLGDINSWILTPDGLTNNPTITLYRGQTYVFDVNSPRNSFYIRSAPDVGPTANYTKGVTNSGTQNGKLTFKVPLDAPDVLYYQSQEEPDRVGRILIDVVESNSKIDINKEIIGKITYTSSNGVEFTNGLIVEFLGQTTPKQYSEDLWLVEGVGEGIKLIRFNDLRPPLINQDTPDVLFDDAGFDTEPFDDATGYPTKKDYITINRSSVDSNPWSRYNRWFHRSVLEYAHSKAGTSLELPESSRAKRPIIEFRPDLQLFNHGAKAKVEVDYIDTFTKDVFSNIEGSLGYNVDGEQLFEGARILVAADTDTWANNKIYQVNFIKHNGRTQISLTETADSTSIVGEGVFVRRGNNAAGLMYHFNGSNWVKSQVKTSVNQPPKFDVFDVSGVSYGDTTTYPVSSFTGTELLSYKIGTGVVDTELGFQLSYLNIDNVGDIQFEFDWDIDKITWQNGQEIITVEINNGFYKVNTPVEEIFENGWTLTRKEFLQPIIESQTITTATNTVVFTACEWVAGSEETIVFYLNGDLLVTTYTRDPLSTFTFNKTFAAGDVLTIKIFTNQLPDQGYYEIPLGLERNPLNEDVEAFTLGQALDHAGSMVELADNFKGSFPGVSNLRDLSGYQANGRRFLKHSASAAVPITMLCDKDANLIRSIQFSKKSYTEFKHNFMTLASELFYDQNPSDFVDDILAEMTKAKAKIEPFSDSDMIGCGAYTKIEYLVEDEGITTFALNEKFDLSTLNRRAVYVYINDVQLIVEKDYSFNSTFGFVTISKPLVVDDVIEIREYVSTAFSYIPATPTSLGLYKKYTPMKYVDDTYQTPAEVIQGHDGSLTFAYGDVRDDVLLELEKRIYNNIKKEYNPDFFDIDKILGGYYGNAVYTKPELDSIINSEFLKWTAGTDIDYVSNDWFDSENSFTYTYSNMSDPTRTKKLPGYWRGVYLWFYDTERPHLRPWEMLGFSEEPTWWQAEYGAAPYTSNNLILWEDLRDGIVRQGDRAGEYDRYKRPTLMDHIPVDGNGKLLSPLDSGLAQDFVLINNQGDFLLGDIAPAEYAWRRSSEYPYAIIIALSLLRPFEFITKFLDGSQLTKNIIGQYVNTSTMKFEKVSDINIPVAGEIITTGLVNWVMDYLRSRAQTATLLRDKFDSIDVNITNRISGFVDQAQQKYLLDSKSPKASSSSIFIPPENYDIFFNVSVPIGSISYSGVILEKTNKGWRVTGYDSLTPYFSYFEAAPGQTDPLIAVGGVSEGFVDWTSGKYYNNGQIVREVGSYYRTITSHTAGATFDNTLYKKLAKLPQVGAVEALKRRSFNKTVTKRLGYGTVLSTIQQVVDFLLGYEQYLISLGMTFEGYDATSQTSKDWFTSAKEFMFWTKHNWAEGSLLTLSPAADEVVINISVGVADNLLDNFYEYQVYKSDGNPLLPNYINVNRDIQKITVSKTNTTDGIYFLKVNFVLKEHVVTFSDRTVFNDVIYDKTAGYRQGRIKVRGFRTTDWDGDYTSPGFLFDNVNIQDWAPFTDYKLGDIVAYREFNWTSLVNQIGSSEFNNTNWTKLDSSPTKGLVPNFDYKINQFDDYYDLDADGVGSSQRDLSRHGIGYQQRDYLQNIAEDQVSQFKIYQGFIREKGTSNAITKVFDKLSRSGGDSVTLNEEWAFRVGRVGGVDQITEVEMTLNKSLLSINPQPILIQNSVGNQESTDDYIRITRGDFTIAPTPFNTSINPTFVNPLPGRSAGYVRNDQVEFVVKTRDDILNLNIENFKENDHVWVTFDGIDWTVLRYNLTDLMIAPTKVEVYQNEILVIETGSPFTKIDNDVTINLNRRHGLSVGDIVGIQDIINLTGFFKITEVTDKTITVTVADGTDDPAYGTNTRISLRVFSEARYRTYESIDQMQVALLRNKSKLWIDSNGTSGWEVIEKNNQFAATDITSYGIADPLKAGSKVLYIDSLKQLAVSMPESTYVVVYNAAKSNISPQQFLTPNDAFATAAAGVFGGSMSVSADNRWMIVGTPLASGVPSQFQGDYDYTQDYLAGDTVLYNGSLWTATIDVIADGSSQSVIDIDTYKWSPTTLLTGNVDGTNDGYFEQGMVTIYEWGSIDYYAVDWNEIIPYPIRTVVKYNGRRYISLVETLPGQTPADNNIWSIVTGRWTEVTTLISPRPKANEHFGSSVSVAGSGTNYTLAISAEGANNGAGRVYLYKNNGEAWSQLENTNYTGVFDANATYYVGQIVWHDAGLWECLVKFVGDGVATPNISSSWNRLSDVATQSSLPSSPAVADDDSTTFAGLLDSTSIVEMVKQGDNFGHSIALSTTGSTLVVGAPLSDDIYFENYKGEWHGSNQEYFENDVVRYHNLYYKLNISSILGGTAPSGSAAWDLQSTPAATQKGKVFVYKKTTAGNFVLSQTVTAKSIFETLPEYKGVWVSTYGYQLGEVVKLNGTYYKLTTTLSINESPAVNPNPWTAVIEEILIGDRFGHCVDITSAGDTIVVSSPFADFEYQNQGAVFVFVLNSTTGAYQFTQRLESYRTSNNENFGDSISISANGKRIVVGAQNSEDYNAVEFDTATTTFDAQATSFNIPIGTTGQVYVFEKKDTTYVLAEKLEADLQSLESFGSSVDCSNSAIVVGSPNYKINDIAVGKVRFFTKNESVDSWTSISSQPASVNISLLKSIALYDPVNNVKINDVDIIDHFKLKVLGLAEQEIKFKTPYDPATYIIGTDNQVVDADQAWFEANVGLIWWNVNTAKWIWYEQGDVAYRTGNWNQLAEGASIDIYEWVESTLLPSEWSILADTNEGLAEGISGQPMYADDTVYNYKIQVNPVTEQVTGTLYYYWVKNKTVLPNNPQRRVSASEVAAMIINPTGFGYPVAALIDADKILAYNFGSVIENDTALLNIQYVKSRRNLNEVHTEYQLLAEGKAESVLAESLESKWLDSLIGFDLAGNQVPDPNLPAKQKYGIEFRPRQSMFINRASALRIVVDRVNAVLATKPFVELLNFSRLNLVDPIPDAELNLYDQTVEQFIDLEVVGTARLRQAILRANIINGEVDTIDVVDSGFGYKVPPPIDIQGTGTGAKAEAVIDSQGRITSVKIIQGGKKYTTVIIRVRSYSVLVQSDSTSSNLWTVYAWDQKSKVFYRAQTQQYNTTNYWETVDYWLSGYDSLDRVVKEIPFLAEETKLSLKDKDLVRVKEYGTGGWAILEKVSTDGEILGKYRLVGREAGTIKLKETLYNIAINNVGYDNVGTYDSIPYDLQPIREIRNIFDAIKYDILINDLKVEWNNLFFASVGYAFSEQLYIDWAFKTSFLSAVHHVGDLAQKTNYKNDNLESFKDYLDEVKPYRTKIREYTAQYTEFQSANSNVTDFDRPVIYSEEDGKVIPVYENSELINTYPWKHWLDNRGYSVTSVVVANKGENYTSPPTVLFDSETGSGAEAKAYISNGRVSGIEMISHGSGYLTAPIVSLVGGNGSNTPAKAVAILGDGKVRNFNVSMKFDRISKQGIYTTLDHEENFIATGATSVFQLSYAPTRDKSKITILKNGELMLNNEYNIDLFTSVTDTYSLLRGKLRFVTAPENGDSIRIMYNKNDLLLDAVNRIERFYTPTSGMLGFALEEMTYPIVAAITNSQVVELSTAKEIVAGMRVTGNGVTSCRVVKVISDTQIVLSIAQTLSAKTILTFTTNKPNQLMTGLDFGGVQIQGNPFDVTGGWDALPWFTDGWDSVETSSDYYHVADGSTESVTLPTAPLLNQQISIYIQRAGETKNTRVDDPYFDNYDGSTVQPNGRTTAPATAVMNTFIGDGVTKSVRFPNELGVLADDVLIFRTADSDGTVNISDVNLIDTNLSGGTLETMRGAYSTATGKTADEIIVDGEKFISPDQVPSPEENVPGQVLESVSIKVFHSKQSGSPTVMSKVTMTSPAEYIYDIGQNILESSSVVVYVDKIKQEEGTDKDYYIKFDTNQVIFNTPFADNKLLEIVSIGIGGIMILDYQEFVADGATRLFLTSADYNSTASVLVTVNGNYTDCGFSNSNGKINDVNKSLVELGIAPEEGTVVKVVCFGAALNTDTNQEPLVRVNQQTITIDGSTRHYTLDNFVDLGTSSARGAILVELNGQHITSSDTVYFVFDSASVNNSAGVYNPAIGEFVFDDTIKVDIGTDPYSAPGSISISDIKVYVNDVSIPYITGWTFSGITNILSILPEVLPDGAKVRIEKNVEANFNIVNGEIVLSNSVAVNDGDKLVVTWFNNYPAVDLVKEVFFGNKVQYMLSRKPVGVSYIWVYRNGDRLSQDVEYVLSLEKGTVELLIDTDPSDLIEIVQFGSDPYRQTLGYEIFKDMLNVHHFKRYSINEVTLAAPLNYFDKTITVTDASELAIPNARRKVPGTVEINNERIEYFTKVGNVLGQLRRGSLGTAIAELHPEGSRVVDVSTSESVPYAETQEKFDFVSDGTTVDIGPFEFVPKKSGSTFYRTTASITNEDGTTSVLYPSIPTTHGRCDELEVFVGGRRLNKDSVTIYEESNAASSPEADIQVEAEFSVSGLTPYIRLTDAVPAGIRITVIKRTGRTWYEPGATTASKGLTMLDNDTVIIKFLEQKSTKLP